MSVEVHKTIQIIVVHRLFLGLIRITVTHGVGKGKKNIKHGPSLRDLSKPRSANKVSHLSIYSVSI